MPQTIAKSAIERTSKRLLDEVFVFLIQKGLTLLYQVAVGTIQETLVRI